MRSPLPEGSTYNVQLLYSHDAQWKRVKYGGRGHYIIAVVISSESNSEYYSIDCSAYSRFQSDGRCQLGQRSARVSPFVIALARKSWY